MARKIQRMPTKADRARRKILLEQGLKECNKCLVVKSVNEFPIHKKNIDGLHSWCKECKNSDPSRIESARRLGIHNRQKFNEYKKTLECESCGYDEDPAKLHFHHRDPDTKLFAVGGMSPGGFTEKFKQEIAKCDVLCQPCHIEQHSTSKEI